MPEYTDERLERLVRQSLHDEADASPIVVDPAVIRARLADRRQRRQERSRLLAAAAVIALAVGGGLLVVRGLGLSAPVAATPAPSIASPLPSGAPPARTRLGAADPDTAVVVRQDVADGSLAVVAVALDGSEKALATIPRAAMPDGTIDLILDPPRVSELGWLAVPILTNPAGGTGVVAVVDLYDATGTTIVIDDVAGLDPQRLVWGPSGRLLVQQTAGLTSADPASGTTIGISLADGIELRGPEPGASVLAERFVWTADGTGILATRTTGDTVEHGDVSIEDGSFTLGTPATYQATGLGRATGSDGSTLGTACDSGPTPSSSGCVVGTRADDSMPIAVWYPETLGAPPALDAAFAADGARVWMLLPPEQAGPLVALFDAPKQSAVIGDVAEAAGSPRFVGLSGGDRRLAMDPGDGRTTLLATDSGRRLDVDGVFAGWEAGGSYPTGSR